MGRLEEKRFFGDVQDLKDFVPKSVPGEGAIAGDKQETEGEARQKERLQREKGDIKKTETEVKESKDEDNE